MTTSGTVQWYGNDFRKLIGNGADDAMFEGGQILLEGSQAKVPRFTGRLHASGYVTTKSKSTYVFRRGYKKERKPEDTGVVGIGYSAPHSHLVEFGTKKMRARPYLRPALDELKSQIGEKIVITWAKLIK